MSISFVQKNLDYDVLVLLSANGASNVFFYEFSFILTLDAGILSLENGFFAFSTTLPIVSFNEIFFVFLVLCLDYSVVFFAFYDRSLVVCFLIVFFITNP